MTFRVTLRHLVLGGALGVALLGPAAARGQDSAGGSVVDPEAEETRLRAAVEAAADTDARADALGALGTWFAARGRWLAAADAWRAAREARGSVTDAEGEAQALLGFAEQVLAGGGIGAGIRAAFEDARLALVRARELGSTSLEVDLGLARCAAAQGNSEAELSELRAALDRRAGDPRLARALGFALLNAESYGAAVEHLRPLSDANPDDVLLARAVSYCARLDGDEDLALAMALRAVEAAPQDAGPWQSLWSIYAPQKRYGELAQHILDAARGRPDNRTAAHYAGFGCSSARRFEDALEWLAKAYELDDANLSARLEVARILLTELKRPAEAAVRYQEVLARDPANQQAVDGLFYVANQHAAAGDHVAALPYFRMLAETRPEDASSQANLGLALRWTGAWDDADAAYRRAIELAPDDPQLRNDYGLLLLVMRRDDDARRAFIGAHEADALHNDGLENLGFMERELGHHEEAGKWFRLAWEAARRRGSEGQEARHRRNLDDVRWPLDPVR